MSDSAARRAKLHQYPISPEVPKKLICDILFLIQLKLVVNSGDFPQATGGDEYMIKTALGLGLLLAMAVIAAAQQPAPPKTTLKVGDAAPDFTLPSTTGEKVKLSDFKGKKNVVLAFYVLAFTGG